jgi:hypothetical protein
MTATMPSAVVEMVTVMAAVRTATMVAEYAMKTMEATAIARDKYNNHLKSVTETATVMETVTVTAMITILLPTTANQQQQQRQYALDVLRGSGSGRNVGMGGVECNGNGREGGNGGSRRGR